MPASLPAFCALLSERWWRRTMPERGSGERLWAGKMYCRRMLHIRDHLFMRTLRPEPCHNGANNEQQEARKMSISAIAFTGLLISGGIAIRWIFARVRAREVAGEAETRLARYGGRRI
jgi:hypothetical protein